MIRQVLVVFMFLIGWQSSFSQEKYMIINANSKDIKILDGDDLLDGVLVPDLKPDIYVYHKSFKSKIITYYTDIDSISFDVKPGDHYDFAILLNNKDTCYQRISYQNPNKVKYSTPFKKAMSSPDTIPFVLGANNAIHIRGSINNSDTLDLIFDTGASIGVLSEEGSDKKATLNQDKNRFEMSGIVIENSPAVFVNYNGGLRADGVVGYNAFEDKVVEVDYDKGIMVIHDSIENLPGSYSAIPMKWRGSALHIECILSAGEKKYRELLIFDTGSKWALSMSREFGTKNGLYDHLTKTGTRRAKGVDGKIIKSNTYTLPGLTIGEISLVNVPIDIELPSDGAGFGKNILGNDVLKRFNTILDYRNGIIYLRPNSLIGSPYNKSIDENLIFILLAVLPVLLIIGFVVYKKRKRQTA